MSSTTLQDLIDAAVLRQLVRTMFAPTLAASRHAPVARCAAGWQPHRDDSAAGSGQSSTSVRREVPPFVWRSAVPGRRLSLWS